MADGPELKRFGKFIEHESVAFYPQNSTGLLIGYITAYDAEYLEPGYLHVCAPFKSLIYVVPEQYVMKLYDFRLMGDADAL
mgnify:CR=1 FL=1